MKLLTTPETIRREFNRLMDDYSEYRWATAWAGINFEFFNKLVKNKNKIRELIIGLDIQGTHPEFIEKMLDVQNVRYVESEEGTFHPKLYLFVRDDRWEMLIGSANFKKTSFHKNTEAVFLVSNADDNGNKLLNEANDFFRGISSFPMSLDELENYRKRWGTYHEKTSIISRMNGLDIPWEEYSKNIEDEENHDFEMRLEVLGVFRELFEKHGHFKTMESSERKAIAGMVGKSIVSGREIESAYFGKAADGFFMKTINDNNENISIALDKIPLVGDVTKQAYDQFIECFKKAFSDKRKHIAGATRLLAMKRPDAFLCINGKNDKELFKKMGMKSNKPTYESYWPDIITKLSAMKWCTSPSPANEREIKKWKGRMALIDCLFYE